MSYIIRSMADSDVDTVYGYYRKIGWEGTQSEWMGHIRYAKGSSSVVTCQDRVVGTGLALIFGSKVRLAGIFIEEEHRNQGLGKKLTQRLVLQCKERGAAQIELEATDLGKLVYEKLGFKAQDQVLSFVLPLSPPAKRNPSMLCSEADLERIEQMDRDAFGASRGAYIRKAFQDSRIFVSKEKELIRGFMICTELEQNEMRIGPWVQTTEEGASDFFTHVLEEISFLKKSKVVIHVLETNRFLVSLLNNLEFKVKEESTRMQLVNEAPKPSYFALWSLDLG